MLVSDEGRGKGCTYKCDECQIEFHNVRKKSYRDRRYHFCSRSCSNKSQKSGVLLAQVKSTNVLRFGCEFPTQSADVMAKQRATNRVCYGCDSQLSAGGVARRAFSEKYGVQNPSQLSTHRDRVRQTCEERYGVSHPFKSETVKTKIAVTCLKRYGVPTYVLSDDWREKTIATNIKRLGCAWPTQSESVQSKIDWKEHTEKRHATMKANGSYTRSVIEDRFYDALCEMFGADEIERQVNVLDHQLDFYVRSVDTYVQFDGVYWHGLDRAIDVIKQFNSPRDLVIAGTYERDAKQNESFLREGLRLIRVTDKEFVHALKTNAVVALICSKFGITEGTKKEN